MRKNQISRNQRIHIPKKVEDVSGQLMLPVDVACVKQAFATANDKRFKYSEALYQATKEDPELRQISTIPSDASELIVITKLKKLGAYILAVTLKSPAKFRPVLINRMQNYSLSALENLLTANFIRMDNPEYKAEREKHQMDALIQLKMVAYVAMLPKNAKCILMRQYKQISIQVGEIINLIMAWKKVMINNGKQKSFESERIKRGKVDNAYCASWSASSNENENLVATHKLCLLSKQHKQGTIMFEIELGRNVTNLVKQLQNKTYRLSPYRSFTIYDPKKRLIEALPYKDRVVLMCFCQHSVAPRLERHLIYDNAASRKEKGTHFAVERLHSFMRKLYIKNKSDLFFEMRHQEIFSKHQS